MFFIISIIVDLFNKFQYMFVHYVCFAIGRMVEISYAHIHNLSNLKFKCGKRTLR